MHTAMYYDRVPCHVHAQRAPSRGAVQVLVNINNVYAVAARRSALGASSNGADAVAAAGSEAAMVSS